MEPLCLADGSVKPCGHMEDCISLPQKIKNRITVWFSNLLLSRYPKELKAGTWTDMCTLMCEAVFFTKAKGWEQARCSSMAELINCGICVGWNSIRSKKKRISDTCCTWMSLEDIMLRERRLSQKDTLHCYELLRCLFIWHGTVLQFSNTNWVSYNSVQFWQQLLGVGADSS